MGRHLLAQALEAGHEVTVAARRKPDPQSSVYGRATVLELDLLTSPPDALSALFRGYEVVINTAGNVSQGRAFVDLVDHVVTGLTLVPPKNRPIAWFLAGVALLDLDELGTQSLDLAALHRSYWPHRLNFERIRRTTLDWRILCPGPMSEEQAAGAERLRVTLDRIPVEVPAHIARLSERETLGILSDRMSEMVVPYADAAALILEHLAPWDSFSGHRIGISIPKEQLG